MIRYKLGKTVTEIHQNLTTTFPESCPTLRTIQRWGSKIQSGIFTLEKGVSSGRPLETRIPENIACVKELIEQKPRMSTREAAADLFLPHTSVHEILKKDLMFKVVLSSWVPHQLSEKNKKKRVECCHALITKQYLARRKVKPIKQSPSSPNLNLCDRFLFRKLKHLLRNEEFNGNEGFTQGVQRQTDKVIKIWLASIFMGCLGEMQDGF